MAKVINPDKIFLVISACMFIVVAYFIFGSYVS